MYTYFSFLHSGTPYKYLLGNDSKDLVAMNKSHGFDMEMAPINTFILRKKVKKVKKAVLIYYNTYII